MSQGTQATKPPTLAIIGGSGLYDVDQLERVEVVTVDTPYGSPSDAIVRGVMKGTETTVLFLPRHGRGHRHPPSAIPYRANLCALKKLGATAVLSVSAVGSMREEIAPGDLVVVDQFIDLTKQRVSTFFDRDLAGHVAFSDPVCPVLQKAVFEVATAVTAAAPLSSDGVVTAERRPKAHLGGTYVCIEGPQFSTRAESLVYRSWGVSVIGMTNMPEAKLAREAELPYATLALSTDYDCWHTSEEPVTVERVIATLRQNVALAKEVGRRLAHALPTLAEALAASPASNALQGAVMTAANAWTPEARARLEWLVKPAAEG